MKRRKKLSIKEVYERQMPNLFTWKRSDWLVFFVVVPLFLIAVQLLPTQITDGFYWNPHNATAVGAFMSNYTHANLQHLSNNLVAYLVTIFLIFCIEPKKGTFRKMSLVIFFVFPFLLTASEFLLTPNKGGVGFSGLAAAFLGYLAYSAYNYLREKRIPLKSSFLALIMLINFGLMLATWRGIAGTYYAIVLLPVLYFAYVNRAGLMALGKATVGIWEWFRKDMITRASSLLILLAVVISVLSFATIVPQPTSQDTQTINILVHYLGYFYVVVIASAIEALKETRDLFRKPRKG